MVELQKEVFSALGNKLVIGNSGIGTSELMVLNLSTGNVGIGTASPASKLHIYSNIAENTYLQIQNGNSGRTLRMGIPTGAPYALLENQAWDNSYQAIAISPNGGNVGIGMTNPTQKLDVAGNVMVYNDILALGGGSYGYQADAGAVRMPNNKNIAWRNSANSANLYLTATPTNQFAFVGGNVLIGQTTQVNSAYKLDINGSARANEIVVNTNGADFVFEEGYKLASLDEVEKHIKTKKHLPGIASAKEMQENGVGVSELQTKLLQKVEELTLYVIELKKQNDEMKKKIGN